MKVFETTPRQVQYNITTTTEFLMVNGILKIKLDDLGDNIVMKHNQDIIYQAFQALVATNLFQYYTGNEIKNVFVILDFNTLLTSTILLTNYELRLVAYISSIQYNLENQV